MLIQPIRLPIDSVPVTIVLGTGDIPSAIGHALFKAGWGVVLLRDVATPVLRRGMAFDDAIEDGVVELAGIFGVRQQAPDALCGVAGAREGVVVANLDLAVVLANWPVHPEALIDARMRKYAMPADLRPLAACAIGVGPGFIADANVDLAIETLPGQEGALVSSGATATATGRAEPLGGAGEERFCYAPIAGIWQPAIALGDHVTAGSPIGRLGTRVLTAPIEGCVRGLVRPSQNGVGRGAKLVEIDPRAEAPWRGLPPRAQRIAAGVRVAVPALAWGVE